MKRGQLTGLTRDGRIAVWQDVFAVRDPDGAAQTVGHMDGVLKVFGPGWAVAYLGRNKSLRGQTIFAVPDGTTYPYTTRAQIEALRDELEAAYARDITQYGTLSLTCDIFYDIKPTLESRVWDDNTQEWITVPPGVCLACEAGKGCWIHHQIK